MYNISSLSNVYIIELKFNFVSQKLIELLLPSLLPLTCLVVHGNVSLKLPHVPFCHAENTIDESENLHHKFCTEMAGLQYACAHGCLKWPFY